MKLFDECINKYVRFTLAYPAVRSVTLNISDHSGYVVSGTVTEVEGNYVCIDRSQQGREPIWINTDYVVSIVLRSDQNPN